MPQITPVPTEPSAPLPEHPAATSCPATRPPSALQWPPASPSPTTRPAVAAPPLFNALLLRYEGCADHYYEDAAAFNAISGFAAVADGVTISSRSDIFAECLTRHFVQGEFYLELPQEREQWWRQCAREWQVQVMRTFSEMSAEQQQQFETGSGAAFIGLRIDLEKGICLYGVGDCYALWFNGPELVETFPDVTRFNNSPTTIDTRMEQSVARIVENPMRELPGDTLVLCSDAFAEFLLMHKPWEDSASFWPNLPLMDDAAFGSLAKELKTAGRLKDDDYTLLMLRFTPVTLAAIPLRRKVEPEPLAYAPRMLPDIGVEAPPVAPHSELKMEDSAMPANIDSKQAAEQRALNAIAEATVHNA